MKNIIFILLVVVLPVSFAAAQNKAKAETVVIKIPTAKCETCEETITNALKKVEGVVDAKANADEKIATVQFTSSKTKLAVLEDTIVNAGYDANKKKRNDAAYKKLSKCCK